MADNKVISKKIIDLLNYRIEQEEYSSRLYQAISMCMSYKGYLGASKLFKKYSEEELIHADWAYDYLLSMDIRPIVPALKAPPEEFEGLVAVLQLAYKHEVEITNQCKELASATLAEGDFMCHELALRYLKEQVEELDKTTKWLDRIDILGGENITPTNLYLLDKELKHAAK